METPAKAARRVLVVDDDPLVADSIRRMLEFDGHQVEVVTGGQEALASFEQRTFDLAMIDYEMPGMKGDQLARAIKQLVPGQRVIMFTGYAEAVSSSAGGAVDLVLGKPFNLEELRRTLARLWPQA